MKHYGLKLFVFSLAVVLASACSGTMSRESVEETIYQAEKAVARGDMAAARNVVSYVAVDTSILTATQMARLSMVYMQMADSLEQETNTNIAVDFYDMAFRTDADSASLFYRCIEPERLQYVETLSNHSANRANPIDMANLPDEMAVDGGFDNVFTDSLPHN